MAGGFYAQLALWAEVGGGVAFLGVAYLLFRRYLLPGVDAVAAARNADVVHAEARRERLRAEMEAARHELEEAERETVLIAQRAAADAERERERIVAEAREERLRTLRNAEAELERGRIAARDRLRIEFIETALRRARTLAAERLTNESNARLVAKTVDDLAGRNR